MSHEITKHTQLTQCLQVVKLQDKVAEVVKAHRDEEAKEEAKEHARAHTRIRERRRVAR